MPGGVRGGVELDRPKHLHPCAIFGPVAVAVCIFGVWFQLSMYHILWRVFVAVVAGFMND